MPDAERPPAVAPPSLSRRVRRSARVRFEKRTARMSHWSSSLRPARGPQAIAKMGIRPRLDHDAAPAHFKNEIPASLHLEGDRPIPARHPTRATPTGTSADSLTELGGPNRASHDASSIMHIATDSGSRQLVRARAAAIRRMEGAPLQRFAGPVALHRARRVRARTSPHRSRGPDSSSRLTSSRHTLSRFSCVAHRTFAHRSGSSLRMSR